MTASLQAGESCRVCTSPYTLYVQDVKGRRTQTLFPQRYCMDCQSFCHTSGYAETPEQKRDILYNNAARFLRIEKQGK